MNSGMSSSVGAPGTRIGRSVPAAVGPPGGACHGHGSGGPPHDSSRAPALSRPAAAPGQQPCTGAPAARRRPAGGQQPPAGGPIPGQAGVASSDLLISLANSATAPSSSTPPPAPLPPGPSPSGPSPSGPLPSAPLSPAPPAVSSLAAPAGSPGPSRPVIWSRSSPSWAWAAAGASALSAA